MLPPGSNVLSSPSYGYHSIVMPPPFGLPPPPPPPLSKGAPMISPASMYKPTEKPFPGSQSTTTRRKTPMVHWGSAYMYQSPRDPNDLPNMWYSVSCCHVFFTVLTFIMYHRREIVDNDLVNPNILLHHNLSLTHIHSRKKNYTDFKLKNV